jgi:excisionase family DNA binding protein
MEVITIETEAFLRLIRSNETLVAILENKNRVVKTPVEDIGLKVSKLYSERLLTTYEVLRMLKMSTRKLSELRSSGEIPFIEVGRKFLYKTEDIDNYINNHYNENTG